MNDFARRLREARINASLTQDQLAKALDVSKSTISMWENGNRIPSIDVTFPLAKALKVSPGFFTGGSVRILPDGGAAPGSAYYDPFDGVDWERAEEMYGWTPGITKVIDIYNALDSSSQEQLIQYGQFLLSQKEEQ